MANDVVAFRAVAAIRIPHAPNVAASWLQHQCPGKLVALRTDADAVGLAAAHHDQFADELDALRLAAGERQRRLAEREVAETDVPMPRGMSTAPQQARRRFANHLRR